MFSGTTAIFSPSCSYSLISFIGLPYLSIIKVYLTNSTILCSLYVSRDNSSLTVYSSTTVSSLLSTTIFYWPFLFSCCKSGSGSFELMTGFATVAAATFYIIWIGSLLSVDDRFKNLLP